MPKTLSKYPFNISTAVTSTLKTVLDNEMNLSGRTLSEIMREALYEYFDLTEEEAVLVRLTPQQIADARYLGWIK